MKKNACAFSGDRAVGPDARQNIADAIENAYAEGYREFWCGMERGADLVFCEILLEFRDLHPEVMFIAVLPHEEHTSDWSEKDRDVFFYLMERCDREIMLERRGTRESKTRRNEYMAKETGRLLVFTDGVLGSTMHMISCAEKYGLEIVKI